MYVYYIYMHSKWHLLYICRDHMHLRQPLVLLRNRESEAHGHVSGTRWGYVSITQYSNEGRGWLARLIVYAH